MDWRLSNEELRDMIQGNFTFHSCLNCNGKGRELVYKDGTICQGVQPGTVVDNCYQDRCDECEGLGGTLKIGKY